MEPIILFTIFFYLLSTAGYISYLFYQKDPLQRAGYYLLLVGFICHSIATGYGFFKSGHLPVQNLHETLILAGWAIAGVYLIFQYKFNLKILGIYAAPLAAMVMIIGSTLSTTAPATQGKTIFTSLWLISHIIVISIGAAPFALACGVGLLYIIQEHTIKTKHHGFFFKRLPALEFLDTTGYMCIAVGFSMLTLGLITGFIYANTVWGRFWRWDPKVVWSGIAWLLYAAMLHGRIALGWRGRKAAVMSIIGFAVLLFIWVLTYY